MWEIYTYIFCTAAPPVHEALARQGEHTPQDFDTLLVCTKRMVMFMQRLNRAS